MKTFVVLLGLSAGFAAIAAAPGVAREPARGQIRFERPWSPEEHPELVDPGLRGLYEEAAVDTYCIVWYDFETVNWQGWKRLDLTAQADTFFHVDDFAGLAGGDFGRLVPIEGAKSMWCGARPNAADPYLCSWRKAPGYGNAWNQELASGPVQFAGPVIFSYRLMHDCEPDYDFVEVTCDKLNGETEILATYSGDGSVAAEHALYLTSMHTKLRFRFTSDAAWSDEDGQWNTDGACIVDSIAVSDAEGLVDFQNFESAPTGARSVGIWYARAGDPFGTYSGLYAGLGLRDKDPCGDNFSTQVVFFIYSPIPSETYPGLYVTPFCKGAGGIEPPCQRELVYSPVIDLTKYSTGRNEHQDASIPPSELPSLGGISFRYTIYLDNPLTNLVLWLWKVRSIDEAGCPGPWVDDNIIYYYWPSQRYTSIHRDIGRLVTSDRIQVAVGIVDMCDVWYNVFGNCAQHTPAPWYDNVRLYRYTSTGPQWSARDIDLFQDNFPSGEFVIESYVRADAANDINAGSNPTIRPGDSIVVDCAAPASGGLAADPAGGPGVYMRVKCSYIGPPPLKPALAGAQLQGTHGTYKSDDGTWTIIQGDTARAAGKARPGSYMFDLNDDLFTRGYRIEYYFTARSADGIESAFPRHARSIGPYFEWTCLPTLNSEVLFVDDSHWSMTRTIVSPAEYYWNYALSGLYQTPPDRYHVNGAYSAASNGPGSRAKDLQLADSYSVIVWECGDIGICTISDGTIYSDKSNDCRMLVEWMNRSEHRCGLWVCGDGVASDLAGSAAASATELMRTWCGVDLAHWSYFDLTGGHWGGGIMNPFITGASDAGIYVHSGVPDDFNAYGGCPVIGSFDVLEKTGGGKYALAYPDYAGTHHYAAIASEQHNSMAFPVRTMWFGFSYQRIRDDEFAECNRPVRVHIAEDTFAWMQKPLWYADAETAPRANSLGRNYPNPFNPATTIRYAVRERGLVRIRIYDVSGRLVRTLVDGVKDEGSWTVTWDGRNDLGADAASGIYFCKMETAGFGATRKLVLLR